MIIYISVIIDSRGHIPCTVLYSHVLSVQEAAAIYMVRAMHGAVGLNYRLSNCFYLLAMPPLMVFHRVLVNVARLYVSCMMCFQNA